jgi:hypothetical protein
MDEGRVRGDPGVRTMLSEFSAFLRLGFEHITDVGGYDHLLFVAALTASDLGQLRRLFWLVTAFTVGHSATLALATLDLVRIAPPLVELLIPVTILATSLVNVAVWTRPRHGGAAAGSGRPTAAPDPERETPAEARARYLVAVGFGLIHGLGFSNFLRAALGGEESLLAPLLAFNVGLEVGQLAIVAALSLLGLALIRGLALPRRSWVLAVSSLTGGMALLLILQRI